MKTYDTSPSKNSTVIVQKKVPIIMQSGDIPDLVTGDRTLISNERRSRLF